MPSQLPSILALGCATLVGAWVLLHRGDGEEATFSEHGPKPSAVDPRSSDAPDPLKPLPQALQLIGKEGLEVQIDPEVLFSFLAKRDANDFVHLYQSATRLGAAELAHISDPALALEALTRGVKGVGELVFTFRELSPADAKAALRHVSHNGDRLVVLDTADYTEEETKTWEHISACKDGKCANFLDPNWRERERAKQRSLTLGSNL